LNKVTNGIIVGVLAIVIIGVIVSSTTNDTSNNIKIPTDSEVINKSENTPITDTMDDKVIDTTQKSGPFQINKAQYKLGEKIFFVIDELQSKDKGQAVFIRPLNSTHSTPYKVIQFDGEVKTSFNQMIEPELEQSLGTCDVESLVGNWAIWFRGTDYLDIEFQILDEIVEGETGFNKPVC
jgi:hypothetical protein